MGPEAVEPSPARSAEIIRRRRELHRLEMEEQDLADRVASLRAEAERKIEDMRQAERHLILLRQRAVEARADVVARPRPVSDRQQVQPAEAAPQRAASTGRSASETGLARPAEASSGTYCEVKPEEAQNPAEYVMKMNVLKTVSRLSLRKLEERARAAGAKLPPSTLSDALKKDELPDPALLRAFLTACGLKKSEVAVWEAHYRALAVREMTPSVIKDPPSRWFRFRKGLFRLLMLVVTREGQMMLVFVITGVCLVVPSSLLPEHASSTVHTISLSTAVAMVTSTLCKKLLRSRSSQEDLV